MGVNRIDGFRGGLSLVIGLGSLLFWLVGEGVWDFDDDTAARLIEADDPDRHCVALDFNCGGPAWPNIERRFPHVASGGVAEAISMRVRFSEPQGAAQTVPDVLGSEKTLANAFGGFPAAKVCSRAAGLRPVLG